MNIFYTDPDPLICAQNLCDKHVVKMPLETAQMLSTAWRYYADPNLVDTKLWCDQRGFYKTAMVNHPSTKWARTSCANYKWLFKHFVALCVEYQYRYRKVHKSFELVEHLQYIPHLLRTTWDNPPSDLTPPPLCMPDKYKGKSAVLSYRDYIFGEKKSFAKWDYRPPPAWFIKRVRSYKPNPYYYSSPNEG